MSSINSQEKLPYEAVNAARDLAKSLASPAVQQLPKVIVGLQLLAFDIAVDLTIGAFRLWASAAKMPMSSPRRRG